MITVLRAEKIDLALLEAHYGFVTPPKVLQALQRDTIQAKGHGWQEDIYEKPIAEVGEKQNIFIHHRIKAVDIFTLMVDLQKHILSFMSSPMPKSFTYSTDTKPWKYSFDITYVLRGTHGQTVLTEVGFVKDSF